MKIHALILFLLLHLVACKKKGEEKPVANFSFDKSEYMAGDIIRLTNTSDNADTYRWTFPDGTTSRDTHVSFQTSTSQSATNPNFKLEAFSKSEDKSDFIVKNVPLKETKGTLLVYGELGFSTTVDVSIDNQKQGSFTIPAFSNTTPQCGEAQYPQFNLTLGAHLFKYSYSSPTYTSTVIVHITGNSCHKLKLY